MAAQLQPALEEEQQYLQQQQPVLITADYEDYEEEHQIATTSSTTNNHVHASTSHTGLHCCSNNNNQQNQQQLSPHDLPANICVCTERNKRHRCTGFHLITDDTNGGGDESRGDHEEDDDDDDCSAARARKRARVDERDSNIRGCCDGDLVERIRRFIRELLERRLAESAIPPLSSNVNNDKATNTYLLETIETLLFSTAYSLEEYADISTLDQRLGRLLVALLNRNLRITDA